METLLQDLRYACTRSRANKAFTAIAVFTLAVGIGANTAIYSMVNSTLLRTLPFADRPPFRHPLPAECSECPTTWCGLSEV